MFISSSNTQVANVSNTQNYTSRVNDESFQSNFQESEMTISTDALNAQSAIDLLSGKYDVTNISNKDKIALSQELQKNGLLSNKEMMVMIKPLGIEQTPETKVNFLEEFKLSVNNSLISGDNLKESQKILSLLEDLNKK